MTPAAQSRTSVGWYNTVTVLDVSGRGAVVVRVPIPGVTGAHPRLWREQDVLSAVAGRVRVPRVLHASTDPPWLVLEHIGGAVLSEVTPAGVPVPGHVMDEVAGLCATLARVPADALPACPVGWPTGTDTVGFARRLSDHAATTYGQFRHRGLWPLFARLGIPPGPFEGVAARWPRLTPRRLGLVHTDLHRGNIITARGRCWWLDWELALWGDPLYEVASHLVKMGYQPREQEALVRKWVAVMPDECTTGWHTDLDAYVAYEQVKTATLFAARAAAAVRAPAGTAPEPASALAARLARKLAEARQHWPPHPDPGYDVADTLTWWGRLHR
jgi:aminoglycoside phosphotransferase (APT) family kinase protein